VTETVKITKREAIKEYRKMWNWIADETERTGECKSQEDYLEFVGIDPKDLANKCFLCEYSKNKTLSSVKYPLSECNFCPLDFESYIKLNCSCRSIVDNEDNGLYVKYREYLAFEDVYGVIDTARQIANLSEKINK